MWEAEATSVWEWNPLLPSGVDHIFGRLPAEEIGGQTLLDRPTGSLPPPYAQHILLLGG